MQPNLSLSSVEVLADVLLDLDEAHLALGVPATLVLLLPRGVATLELAPENDQIIIFFLFNYLGNYNAMCKASLLVRSMPFSKEPTRAVQAAHGGSLADFLSSFFTWVRELLYINPQQIT